MKGGAYQANADLKEHQTPAEEAQQKLDNYNLPKAVVELQRKAVRWKSEAAYNR